MLNDVKVLISEDLWCLGPEGDAQWRQLLQETAPEDAPVVHGLLFGHRPANLGIPVGAVVEIIPLVAP